MKSWAILRHSIRQVFGNLGAALRISAALFAVQSVASFGMARFAEAQPGDGNSAVLSPGQASAALVVALLAMLLSLWIAVPWHRHVLQNEPASGLIPPFLGGRMLGYLGASLALGLMLGLPAAGAVLLLQVSQSVAAGLSGVAGQIFTTAAGIGIETLLGGIAFRLLAGLPGFALEPGHRIASGWQATRGATGTLMGLAFICSIGLTALGLVVDALPAGLALPGTILADWLVMIVGVSTLTTLFGHYIQGRELV